MRLAHIALWTTDIEASARFWATYFPAEVGPRYESRNRPGFVSRFVILSESGVQIELMEGPWVGRHGGETSGWAHVAFSLGSREAVDLAAERFRSDGLLLSPPRRTGDGYYEAMVRAPDGTIIEIVV